VYQVCYSDEILIPGRDWKGESKPNHNPALKNTFAKRIAKAKQVEVTKALEKQLNEERKVAENVSEIMIILMY
jgi:hypothetical protein